MTFSRELCWLCQYVFVVIALLHSPFSSSSTFGVREMIKNADEDVVKRILTPGMCKILNKSAKNIGQTIQHFFDLIKKVSTVTSKIGQMITSGRTEKVLKNNSFSFTLLCLFGRLFVRRQSQGTTMSNMACTRFSVETQPTRSAKLWNFLVSTRKLILTTAPTRMTRTRTRCCVFGKVLDTLHWRKMETGSEMDCFCLPKLECDGMVSRVLSQRV